MINKDVAIVGCGPAGLTAAIKMAELGLSVLLIDANETAGGQLFKQIHKFFGSKTHDAGIRGIDIGKKLIARCIELKVETWLSSVVLGIDKDLVITVERQTSFDKSTFEYVKAKKILIATGASEKAVYFKGWTLPGVMGAGAIQTMINVHRVLPGKRFLMVGSGNVGLIVSYQLLQAGAEVVGIVEGLPCINGYAVHASKIARAGVPILTSHTVKEVLGTDRVERVTIVAVDKSWNQLPGTEKTIEVDSVGIATGMRPLESLAEMSGCKSIFNPASGGWVPIHNKNMETSRSGVYIAGDVSGIEEASVAMEEGRLAGIAIAESLGYILQEDAKEEKQESWWRLDALRSGHNGDIRKFAKQAQILAMEELGKD